MKIGAIYVYEHPQTARPMYVGSVQNCSRLRKRHRQHLCDKKNLLCKWLLSFDNVTPIPRHIASVQFNNARELFEIEDAVIAQLETNVSLGGLNQVSSIGPDHSAIGKIGGPIGGRIGGRMRALGGKLNEVNFRANPDLARKVASVGGAIRAKQFAASPGLAAKVGKLGGDKRARLDPDWGRKTMHNRWHVKRNQVNPNCIFCVSKEGK